MGQTAQANKQRANYKQTDTSKTYTRTPTGIHRYTLCEGQTTK